MQELDKILEIAHTQYEKCECEDYLLQQRIVESSYISRKDTVYLKEMDYSTPIKLQAALQEMWQSKSELQLLEKIIVVAAFKLRDSDAVYRENIKEKVYNF